MNSCGVRLLKMNLLGYRVKAELSCWLLVQLGLSALQLWFRALIVSTFSCLTSVQCNIFVGSPSSPLLITLRVTVNEEYGEFKCSLSLLPILIGTEGYFRF